jgi:SAM-dependent methyltransferase
MLDLMQVLQRTPRPQPWAEGEKIPWNEPGFSRRMLREHLSQEHDWASRRSPTIQQHIDWIHRQVLHNQPSRILDLGCGPGLYSSRLAQLGHACTGLDFSPASIEYARDCAHKAGLNCSYRLEDVRQADFGLEYDLALFIYGEFNVFCPTDSALILQKCHAALQPGASLLLEVHEYEVVRRMGLASASWYSSDAGLFSDRPHFCLQENFWDAVQSVATLRYIILDAQTARVTRYASSTQAYTRPQYLELLNSAGFKEIEFFPSLSGGNDLSQPDLFVILAKK